MRKSPSTSILKLLLSFQEMEKCQNVTIKRAYKFYVHAFNKKVLTERPHLEILLGFHFRLPVQGVQAGSLGPASSLLARSLGWSSPGWAMEMDRRVVCGRGEQTVKVTGSGLVVETQGWCSALWGMLPPNLGVRRT